MNLSEWNKLSLEERKAVAKSDQPGTVKLARALMILVAIVVGLIVIASALLPDPPPKPKTQMELIKEKYPNFPENSSWDGSVFTAKQALKQSLNDPDSYESVEWYQVVSQGDGTFFVKHRFRAANAFGAKILQTYGFVLDSAGNVLKIVPQ